MRRADGQMIQVAPPAVMAAKDGPDDRIVLLGHEAHPRVAHQIGAESFGPVGIVQANAPRILRAKSRPPQDLMAAASRWAWALAAIPAALTLAALSTDAPQLWLTAVLGLGLLVFGAVFAVNSSLHSYLILAFTKAERVTMVAISSGL